MNAKLSQMGYWIKDESPTLTQVQLDIERAGAKEGDTYVPRDVPPDKSNSATPVTQAPAGERRLPIQELEEELGK